MATWLVDTDVLVDHLRALLSSLEPLPVQRGVAQAAGEYRRHQGPSHGVLLPDAITAATARAERATLITSNRRHFPMEDLQVASPKDSCI